MFHRLASIRPVGKSRLRGVFVTGEVRYYDVEKLFEEIPVFRCLLDNQLFNKVKVDSGGYGISWNDEIDLSADEIYENGISEPFKEI